MYIVLCFINYPRQGISSFEKTSQLYPHGADRQPPVLASSLNLSMMKKSETHAHEDSVNENFQKKGGLSPCSTQGLWERQRTSNTNHNKYSPQTEETPVIECGFANCFNYSPKSESASEQKQFTFASTLNLPQRSDHHQLNNRKLFFLRPQSISANVGETATFSCVIRPPPATLKFRRVSWLHKNLEINQEPGESPRVTLKTNYPYDGVFQLKLTSICLDDQGYYEIIALDQEDMRVCSATFHLSVEGMLSPALTRSLL